MVNRPAAWFQRMAILSAATALLMVPALSGLMLTNLPLWLHIPATALVLGLISMGAVAAGVAYAEYRARSAGGGQQT